MSQQELQRVSERNQRLPSTTPNPRAAGYQN